MASASAKSLARYIARTGESFSCANSSESSTLSTSPMRTFVSSGTSKPASFAMVTGFCPTIFALSAPLMRIVLRVFSVSAGESRWQPDLAKSARTSS